MIIVSVGLCCSLRMSAFLLRVKCAVDPRHSCSKRVLSTSHRLLLHLSSFCFYIYLLLLLHFSSFVASSISTSNSNKIIHFHLSTDTELAKANLELFKHHLLLTRNGDHHERQLQMWRRPIFLLLQTYVQGLPHSSPPIPIPFLEFPTLHITINQPKPRPSATAKIVRRQPAPPSARIS